MYPPHTPDWTVGETEYLNCADWSHQAGSSFLILWILQENGLLGIDRGYYGSPRPYSAKSDKSNFG